MSETKTYGTVHGYDVVDVPEAGYYIAINSQDTKGNVTKKAVLISASNLHEDKNYCTLNYTVADYKGNTSGVFIVSGSEGKSNPSDVTNMKSPHKKIPPIWSKEFTVPAGREYSFSSDSSLTEDQINDLPNGEAKSNYKAYFLGNSGKIATSPIEIPFDASYGEQNNDVVEAMKANGFDPGTDSPIGGYYIQDGVFMINAVKDMKFKIEKFSI